MKILSILFVAASILYITPVEANNQQKSPSIGQAEKKIYVNPESLYLSKEGIFLQISQNKWIPVREVGYDSQGVYLRGGISWSYYECTSCGRRYESLPSECNNCGGTSFEFVYEDVWDR